MELLFHVSRVSVQDDNKDLPMGKGDGCIMGMYAELHTQKWLK